jgi:hypothetical protein
LSFAHYIVEDRCGAHVGRSRQAALLYHLPRRGASHATKNRALAAITATPATNHNTLYAKAKLVGPLLDDEHGTLPEDTEAFLPLQPRPRRKVTSVPAKMGARPGDLPVERPTK